MILSMTGYGEAYHQDGGVSYALEIRSLNNRYFKSSIKLPEHLQFLEPEVERLLRQRVGRGSVTYSLRVRNTSADAAYEINEPALRSYIEQLRAAMAATGGDGNMTVDLAPLLAMPGVCQPRVAGEEAKKRWWGLIQDLTDRAIQQLLTMRQNEGRALRVDLLSHITKLGEHMKFLRERAPEVIKYYQERLRQRVETLLSDVRISLDKQDLLKEIAIFAERCDISEEIARFLSHLDQFTTLCDSKELAGRKLDFLAQEMLREANTIGSKANDSEISCHVVEVKSLIDRLKEQVQNVE
ncbi:MAG: YicC family protein [Phycisphaerae bacterium]|nr:YicC family protein [Phycisphaerae bacterium]